MILSKFLPILPQKMSVFYRLFFGRKRKTGEMGKRNNVEHPVFALVCMFFIFRWCRMFPFPISVASGVTLPMKL
jgi:hypothetical protein